MRRASSQGRIHTFADILLRYTRYAFVISEKGDTRDMVTQACPRFPQSQEKEGETEAEEIRKMLY